MKNVMPSFSKWFESDLGDNKPMHSLDTQPGARLICRLLTWSLIFVAAFTAISWIILILAHYDDRYQSGLPFGTWVTLAKSANEGSLYLPLYDGEYYGGSRYMPLAILLIASFAKMTGEYLIASKIAAYVCAIALLGISIAAMRERKCPWAVCAALAALILLTKTGKHTANDIGGETLATFWQVSAVYVSMRFRTIIGMVFAGLCVALGVLTKTSSGWAPMAIGLWLLFTDRKLLGVFCLSAFGSFAAGFGLFHVISDGRITESIFGLTTSGIRHKSDIVLWAPPRLFQTISDWAPSILIMLPFTLGSVIMAAACKKLNPWHLSIFSVGLVTIVISADVGGDGNHLIDLLVVTTILSADLWNRTRSSEGWSTVQMIYALAIVTCGVGDMMRHNTRDVRAAIDELRTGEKRGEDVPHPLSDLIATDEIILSEDPYVPNSLGQRPVVSDAFMIMVLDKSYPEWIDDLIERIERKDFSHIILKKQIDPESWWSKYVCFGPRVARAIQNHYQFEANRYDYFLYRPRIGMTDDDSSRP